MAKQSNLSPREIPLFGLIGLLIIVVAVVLNVLGLGGNIPFLLESLVALAGLCILGMLFAYWKTGHARVMAQQAMIKGEKDQEGILRLMDELGSLADGDLTVEASVTEDVTGSIADSINYAVDALRELVVTIDQTATQVNRAAQQTQVTANKLSEVSASQNDHVIQANDAISSITESIRKVSNNAEISSNVAQQSVQIADKGGKAVRRTIEGMASIRETIQETSKRIKRLGESSQEIGNIVGLINDIAEQTNILALNASIQASMAGEAGRGFAVVADEVQRLAERATDATRQIETLVKTIQTDTNEAVASMEESTANVVGGAKLAENAGEALDEIQSVSKQISELITGISSASQSQAVEATNVIKTMEVLRKYSTQTAGGASVTSTNVSKLADLANELRESVEGFTLPEQNS
ncbi:MAG: methyl-accepting chemotaxis protein [Gammaproteobacteria bacterium]|nr:methyl-accepting chemotaxis protein [Gammaproteobacteria bacterium]NNC97902.1 methyl-accepting chemotaxis protein [Gammaproteobacteria bacterium]NNM13529.1 methyl-accepting chemotaxis protein [Gammaproteobacteria bacterium]